MIDNTPPPAMDMIKKAEPNLVYFPSPCMDSGHIAGHKMALVKLNRITDMIDIRHTINLGHLVYYLVTERLKKYLSPQNESFNDSSEIAGYKKRIMDLQYYFLKNPQNIGSHQAIISSNEHPEPVTPYAQEDLWVSSLRVSNDSNYPDSTTESINITLEKESIKTRTVSNWKKEKDFGIQKNNTIFLIYK